MTIDSYTEICQTDASLRAYQQKAKREIFEAWDEVDSVMFQMPTGTGKTRLFTSIISDINEFSINQKEAVKILIVAHRTELIEQIDKSLKGYQVPHGIIAGGKERDYKRPVQIASIQTLTNKYNVRDAKKLKVQFVIIDEAHHALAATYKKLWDMYPDAKRLGVTATPWRMNHQSFTDLFDRLVLSMPIKEFIRQGFLAPYKYFSLKDDSDIQKTIDDIELDRFGEFKESSMEEKMDIGSIRAQLLDSYLHLAEGKKGIIYAININHAKHICREYERAGYRAVSIDSKTPAAVRKELVAKFRKGEIDIIVNVDIFSEGFDCPDIEFIQLARPTRSLVKYLQQVGRGLRTHGDKEACVILDNVGMYSRFGLPDARRHWRQHFLGKKVDEEPQGSIVSKGTGRQRFVDTSEGTEDMMLIQEVEGAEISKTVINDFFPLWGVILGQTTRKEAKEKGYAVKLYDGGPSRLMRIQDVVFWDDNGAGVFTSIYWTKNGADFPPSWEAKGFAWKNSYDAWIDVFKKLGFTIDVKEKPSTEVYRDRDVLTAYVVAPSPDGVLEFGLDFDCGEHGSTTSSPQTLYSLDIVYKGTGALRITQESEGETFDPVTMLQDMGYENPDFVFWQRATKKIYECYIEDDAYYVINELSIDNEHQKIVRTRIGQIPLTGFMGYKLMRHSLANLSRIRHHGGTNSEFHFDAVAKEGENIVDKGYNFYGNNLKQPGQTDSAVSASADIENERINKAEFHIDVASTDLIIYRKKAGLVKKLARIPQKSDFGLALGGENIARNLSRNRKERLNFCIYRTDKESIYVKVKEQDTDFIYRFNMQGKRTKRILLSKFPDVWSAMFDGRHQLKNVQWEKPRKFSIQEPAAEPIKEMKMKRQVVRPVGDVMRGETLLLSVRQATYEKIEEGRKRTVSRAMIDDKMARLFFKYENGFVLNKKITAYTPSFSKVIEDECPFVPVQYQFLKINAEGISRPIVKRIKDISVKKSYDVNDKYNWVVVYSIE